MPPDRQREETSPVSHSLNDPTLFRQAALVGGNWIEADPANAIAVTNPATGAVIGHVFAARRRTVFLAISSTCWPHTSAPHPPCFQASEKLSRWASTAFRAMRVGTDTLSR